VSQSSTAESSRVRTAARVGAVTAAVGSVVAIAMMTAEGGRLAQAQVTGVNPLDPALDFNAFVEGDTVLTSHEMEGPLATGGDLSMQGLYNISIHDTGTFVDGSDARSSSLVVGGAVDWDRSSDTGEARVLTQGYVKVGDLAGTEVLNTDQNGASVNTRLVPSGADYDSLPRVGLTVSQPVDSVGPTSPIDFDAAFAEFRSTSTDLAACAATATMTDANGAAIAKGEVEAGMRITVALTEGQTNVLHVTGSDIENMSEIQYVPQPTAASPLLINVDTGDTGGVLDWTVPNQPGASGASAPYILWNFNDATELTLAGGDTVEGSIYAPNAAFTDLSATNVEGQVVVAGAALGSLSADGGETHYFPFDAELTCEADVDPSPSTTGPTTYEPTTDEPTTDEPTTDQPTTDEPTTDEPTTDQPTTDEPTTDEPTTDQPTTDEPTTDEPTTDQPTTGQVTSESPTSDGSTGGIDTADGGMLSTTGTSLVAFGIAALALAGAGAALLAADRRRRGQS
jgi:choice-of-anchor A domain-containing protein